MAQKPGNRNGSVGHAFVRRDCVDDSVELGKLGVIQEGAFKEAILEWRPGLNDNFFQPAVI
jgi:hypothetical protein